MTPTDHDAEAIAAGLSEAQRRAIIHSPWTDRVSFYLRLPTYRALKRRGIIAKDSPHYTLLGIRVRAIIHKDTEQ